MLTTKIMSLWLNLQLTKFAKLSCFTQVYDDITCNWCSCWGSHAKDGSPF